MSSLISRKKRNDIDAVLLQMIDLQKGKTSNGFNFSLYELLTTNFYCFTTVP
jgi:hypothetical protein